MKAWQFFFVVESNPKQNKPNHPTIQSLLIMDGFKHPLYSSKNSWEGSVKYDWYVYMSAVGLNEQ